MREILFRAKRKDNGEWVDGDLLRETDVSENVITRIYVMKAHHTFIKHEVFPETVSQYTGLTDKNGNRIWENDIVKKEFYTDYDAYANSDEYIGVVTYEDCAWTIKTKKNGYNCAYPIFMALSESHDAEHYKVIGNVFDNADLLKESEE